MGSTSSAKLMGLGEGLGEWRRGPTAPGSLPHNSSPKQPHLHRLPFEQPFHPQGDHAPGRRFSPGGRAAPRVPGPGRPTGCRPPGAGAPGRSPPGRWPRPGCGRGWAVTVRPHGASGFKAGQMLQKRPSQNLHDHRGGGRVPRQPQEGLGPRFPPPPPGWWVCRGGWPPRAPGPRPRQVLDGRRASGPAPPPRSRRRSGSGRPQPGPRPGPPSEAGNHRE